MTTTTTTTIFACDHETDSTYTCPLLKRKSSTPCVIAATIYVTSVVQLVVFCKCHPIFGLFFAAFGNILLLSVCAHAHLHSALSSTVSREFSASWFNGAAMQFFQCLFSFANFLQRPGSLHPLNLRTGGD